MDFPAHLEMIWTSETGSNVLKIAVLPGSGYQTSKGPELELAGQSCGTIDWTHNLILFICLLESIQPRLLSVSNYTFNRGMK